MATNNNFIKVTVLQDLNAPFDPVLGVNYYGQNGSTLPVKVFNTGGGAGIRHPVIQITGPQFGFPSAVSALYTRFTYLDDQGNLEQNIVTPVPSDTFFALL